MNEHLENIRRIAEHGLKKAQAAVGYVDSADTYLDMFQSIIDEYNWAVINNNAKSYFLGENDDK